MMKNKLRLGFSIETLEQRCLLAVLVVDSAGGELVDDGLITLPEAIRASNTDSVADGIEGEQRGSGHDIIRFAPSLSEIEISTALVIEESVRFESTEDGLTLILDDLLITRVENKLTTVELFDISLIGVVSSEEDLRMSGGDSFFELHGSGHFIGKEMKGAAPKIFGDAPTVRIEGLRPNNFGSRFFASSRGGTYHIIDSEFSSDRSSAIGLGVYTEDSASITLEGITVTGFLEHGAEIFARGSSNIVIRGSTFSQNGQLTGPRGGALKVVTVDVPGVEQEIQILNSTFSANMAEAASGIMFNLADDVRVRMDQLTIVDNIADVGLAAFGFLLAVPQDFEMSNSIIAGNSDSDGLHDIPSLPQISNSFIGFSRVDSYPAGTNIVGTVATGPLDPLLGPLQNNGGSTLTHSLGPLSPATNTGATSSSQLEFDQRGPGFPRIVGHRRDMGAFEFQAVGDFGNTDGVLACADVDRLVQEIILAENDVAFDLTGDGVVDIEDLHEWVYGIFGTLNGDANLDGVVDVADFNVWNSNKFSLSSGWCSGDFNADGSVDVADFNSWNSNKFQSVFQVDDLRTKIGSQKSFDDSLSLMLASSTNSEHLREIAPTRLIDLIFANARAGEAILR